MRQKDLFQTEPAPWELDDAEDVLVASVVFPESPVGTFSYAVPEELRQPLRPGMRIRVPLGKSNRLVTAYCVAVGNEALTSQRLKSVKSIVDHTPLVLPTMLELTQWMSDYYLCPWGQTLERVVPAGVRGLAGTREMTFLSVPTSVAARLTQLKLPAKQAAALKILAASQTPLTPDQLAAKADCTTAPINGLRKKQLVHAETRRVHRDEFDLPKLDRQEPLPLNEYQQAALDRILTALNAGQPDTLLLHGVTGSGKTEVYIRAIDEVIHFGRQAIVLVPEISLTPQTRQRFSSRFSRVAVLHSHQSDAERHWHWQRIARGEIQVVVGARSAVFAPLPNLGLIVIDEEHDSSFKQDSAPRYHARTVAMKRSALEKIPLVLGTATPSLESWLAARDERIQLVSLPNRVLDRAMPDVATIDLRAESQEGGPRGAISRPLKQSISQALHDGGQVILLLNRRGFATSILCPACGHVVKCPHCDITLTYHLDGQRALCHFCDHEIKAPPACPECRFDGIRYGGQGTQRLEEEVRRSFPDVACLRMDSDTMKKAGSHEEGLERFRSGEVRILLGTQMIAKGLDFPNVTLVGVVNADTALHFPDFRSAERTFQLVTQVAGRTGRGQAGGRVLVQSFSPEHPAIQSATRHDYRGFADHELEVRKEFGYPPFCAAVRLIIRGPDEAATWRFAEQIGERMEGNLPDESARLLGPAPAQFARLRGKFRFHILLIGHRRPVLRKIVQDTMTDVKIPEQVQWAIDVDPMDLL